MRAAFSDTLARLPGPPSTSYPEGLPFTQALSDGSMSAEDMIKAMQKLVAAAADIDADPKSE